jgi:tetratricopeptide (TPR) repeat protein
MGKVVVALLVLSFGVARADDLEKMRARQLHEQGVTQLAAKSYDEAIASLREAYEFSPLPQIQFSLGKAYRLKGNKREAAAAYGRYLEAEPNGANAGEARGHLATLSKDVAAEDARKASEEEARERAEASEREAEMAAERKRREALRREEEKQLSVRERDEQDEREQERKTERGTMVDPGRPGAGLRVGGLVTAGVGVAVVGVGAIFGMRASTISDELTAEHVKWSQDRYDEGLMSERLMIVSVIVGTAVVTTGIILYVLGQRQGESSVSFVPTVGEVNGLAAVGSF